jgi:hypothetical protein
MAKEKESSIPMELEAELEATQLDVKREKRGYESLRGVRRSSYMRRSLLRMLSKSPEELEAYSPRNGFEMVCRNMILASNSKDRYSAVAVSVFKEVKEALGERIGSNWKETQEHAKPTFTIHNDLPTADHPCIKPELEN